MSDHPHFEIWLEEETDKNVLFFITLSMSMKIYDRNRAYARYRLLWDRELWGVWRMSRILRGYSRLEKIFLIENQ
ncbi:MAG: hypothetical protein HC817_12175 [Saprospiraceae bacterium]|nr:hypothetical protein [Saprospiraceae bacterium]